MMKLKFNKIKSFGVYFGALALLLLLCYTAYLHGTNMFSFPYYESDEGTYTSQAWSVIKTGDLSPYTYWYDHPPMGWLVIAGWYLILPDSYFTFGNSLDTTRVLMLLIFLVNTTLVFSIIRHITKSVKYALIGSLLYVSSPLVLYFSRRILLDNIQTLWLLLSVISLISTRLTLRNYILSGIFFGFAFLTKITAVMFGIPFLFLIIALKDGTHKMFRTFSWLCASGAVVSTYFIFALIKSELFPPIFSDAERVSFWGTLQFQLSRGGENLSFYQTGSEFLNAVTVWLQRDPVIVFTALAALMIGSITFVLVKNVWYRFFVLANLFFLLFLIRGGLVIDFYFMPMAPFISILVGLIVSKGTEFVSNTFDSKKINLVLSAATVALIIIIIGYYNTYADQRYLTTNETKNQIAATDWIKRTLPENADILIDSVMYVELHDPAYLNNKSFENAEWFYKVSRDPEVRDEKYDNDWQRFDYIALTHEMLKQIDNFPEEDLVTKSFDNALPIVKWFDDSTAFIDEQKRISTNGDWAMVYDISSESRVRLESAWEYYKENFIFSYGQVVDPSGEVTTSEGQSYAMLRAVWMNDHDAFKGVWLWTQHHLQHRLEDKLISWKWVDDTLADSANATDADIDIALALLFGYHTFGEDQYLADAKEIISDIWDQAVIEIDGKYHVVSSNLEHGQVPNGLLFNPSYLSPAHFRIFSDVDTNPDHDWNKLADDTYKIINNLKINSQTPLIKNWYVVNPETGLYYSASPYIGESADQFSYDAFRIFWRVWLDYAWFNNSSAQGYLRQVGNYLNREIGEKTPPSIIDPVTGRVISYRDALAITSSYVFPLSLVDDDGERALEFYKSEIEETYDEAGYWQYETVYYDQNWAWFTSAFYNNDVYNIWASYQFE